MNQDVLMRYNLFSFLNLATLEFFLKEDLVLKQTNLPRLFIKCSFIIIKNLIECVFWKLWKRLAIRKLRQSFWPFVARLWTRRKIIRQLAQVENSCITHCVSSLLPSLRFLADSNEQRGSVCVCVGGGDFSAGVWHSGLLVNFLLSHDLCMVNVQSGSSSPLLFAFVRKIWKYRQARGNNEHG